MWERQADSAMSSCTASSHQFRLAYHSKVTTVSVWVGGCIWASACSLFWLAPYIAAVKFGFVFAVFRLGPMLGRGMGILSNNLTASCEPSVCSTLLMTEKQWRRGRSEGDGIVSHVISVADISLRCRNSSHTRKVV